MKALAAPNHPLRGISWMIAGVLSGVTLDVCVKWLLADYPLTQVVFLRSVFGLLTLLLITVSRRRLSALRTKRPGWHALRSVLSLICSMGFFYSLITMPLADAVTLAFAAPILVTALSVPLLGERVGLARWLAVGIGFAGVVIAMRPGAGMFQPAVVALLISVVAYALLAITARKLAFTESPECLSVWVYPATVLALAVPASQQWVVPDVHGWFLLIAGGLLSAIAFICINAAYRNAPASVVVPFEYTSLIWAALAGAILWNEYPDRWIRGGALVIVASGLFILYRESRRRARPNTFPVQDVSVSRLDEASES